MIDIQSPAAEIRRGKKDRRRRRRRKKLQGKNIMAPLLHRVAIITRSTGTVHTSAKARLTSVVIRIQIQIATKI